MSSLLQVKVQQISTYNVVTITYQLYTVSYGIMFVEKSSGSSVQTHGQTEPPKVHGGLQVSVIPSAEDVKKPDISQSSRIKNDNTHKDNDGPASKRRYR